MSDHSATRRAGLALLCGTLLASAAAAGAAQPAPLGLSSQLQGAVLDIGNGHGGGLRNGNFTGMGFGFRSNSWAGFYIPPGRYATADIAFTPRYLGPSGPDLIGIYDVRTPLITLLTGLPPVSRVFDDLGDGSQYLQQVLYEGIGGSYRLSSQAVHDINAAAGGWFVLGFTNLTTNDMPTPEFPMGVYVNGWGETWAPIGLTLQPVPEAQTWAMLLAGLAMLAALPRARRHGARVLTAPAPAPDQAY